MADQISAVLQIVQFTLTRFVQDFARGIGEHSSRVRELGVLIQGHAETLELVDTVYEQFRDSPNTRLQRAARNLRRQAEETRTLLRRLTHIRDDIDIEDPTPFRRLLEYWSFDQQGGRQKLEDVKVRIRDLQSQIQITLQVTTIVKDTPSEDTAPVNEALIDRPMDDLVRHDSVIQQEVLSSRLTAAIEEGDWSKIKEQLRAGDTLLALDGEGNNAVHYAVESGDRSILAKLLKTPELKHNPRRIDNPNGNGEYPLHLAVRHDRDDLARTLLQFGADVNARDKYLCSPLERALRSGTDAMVELLLDYGAEDKYLRHGDTIDPGLWRRLVQVRLLKMRRRRQ